MKLSNALDSAIFPPTRETMARFLPFGMKARLRRMLARNHPSSVDELIHAAKDGDLFKVTYLWQKIYPEITLSLTQSPERLYLQVAYQCPRIIGPEVMRIAQQNGHHYITDYVKNMLLKQSSCNEDGFCTWKSPPVLAALIGDMHIIRNIFPHRISLDSRHASDAFEMAVKHGQIDVVKYFCEHANDKELGILIRCDFRTNFGTYDECINRIPIMMAAKCGHLNIVQYLYEKGGENMKYIVFRALQFARENGCVDVIKYLTDKVISCQHRTSSAT